MLVLPHANSVALVSLAPAQSRHFGDLPDAQYRANLLDPPLLRIFHQQCRR